MSKMVVAIAGVIAGVIVCGIILLVMLPMIWDAIHQSAKTMNIRNEFLYQQYRESVIFYILLVFFIIIALIVVCLRLRAEMQASRKKL